MFESTLKKMVLNLAIKKVEEDQINDTTSLTNDLGFDSILFVELIVNLEIEFNITIDDEDLDVNLFLNFGNLYNYVKDKIEKQANVTQAV